MYDYLLNKLSERDVDYMTPVCIELASSSYNGSRKLIGAYPGKGDELVEAIIDSDDTFIPIILPSMFYSITYVKVADICRFDLIEHAAFIEYINMLPKSKIDSDTLSDLIYNRATFLKEGEEDDVDKLVEIALGSLIDDDIETDYFDDKSDTASIKLVDITEEELRKIFNKQ